ncbi:MAG: hypothetical protein H0V61_05650 [Chitinophagales bacterium]|jgi:hypothetical protein|nr:hypothetical protein [Chitinophagales bacterium]
MELLSKLTPAETLMLLKPSDSRLRDLMKFTLMDLLARHVLQMPNFDKQPVQGTATLHFAYVIVGRTFKREEPKLHEMIFLYPYYKKPNAKILFRHLIQMALKASKGEEHFKKKFLLDSPELKPMIKIGFWQRVFGSFAHTEEGKIKSEEVILYFNRLDKELPLLMKDDKEKADAYINAVKGNVLLLNALKFELLHLIGLEITNVEEQVEGGG